MWSVSAENQIHRLRRILFRSVLRKDLSWYDTHKSGELNTRLTEDIENIRNGIGDKLAVVIQWTTTFFGGLGLGFAKSWKLTLVIMAVAPLIAISAALASKAVQKLTSLELNAYAKAGAIAEEVLSSMRTVAAFGGEDKEVHRYTSNLDDARKLGIKRNTVQAASLGILFFFIFLSYALAFWYGTKLFIEDGLGAGEILITFFGVLFGAFSLGSAAPNIADFTTARGAAATVFDIIDEQTEIDSGSEEGKTPSEVTGVITFEDVHFSYPSRPDIKILNGLNLEVNVGKTVALVGPSGCGKSTAVQLVQRFYDPSQGAVKLDGTDIREFNIKWLREKIGVVSQEPVLFATSIAENIRYGRLDVTAEEIETAAMEANAHEFIASLPDGYNTLVGDRGAQLSGGQKQRIAIARALVRNPKILLLDEATSALDTESEGIVQAALEKVQSGRTTIVIAHRLSTIQNADLICSLKDGKVAEKGSHEELMAIDSGIYSSLVALLLRKNEKTTEEDEVLEEEIELNSKDEELTPILTRKMSRNAGNDSFAGRIKRMVSTVSDTSEHLSEEKIEETEVLEKFSIGRIMKLNSPEYHWIFIGCIAAAINGASQPAFAVVFSRILEAFSFPEDELKRRSNLYCGFFALIGVIMFAANLVQGATFGKSGEELTKRVRSMSFKAMLRQEISWFDDHKNSTGSLTTRLAKQASDIQGATGARLGTLIQSFCNIGTAIIIAFIYGWQLTLLVLAFLPLIAVAGAIQWKVIQGSVVSNKAAYEGAGRVSSEAIDNIRTVASLAREDTFYEKYEDYLEEPYRASVQKGLMGGFAFGFSQCIIFFAYAATFRLGSDLVIRDKMEFENVFLVFSAIVFGGFALGRTSSLAPDYSKAKAATAQMFKLIDKVPYIDSYSTSGQILENFKPEIHFRNVKFRYPSRPDVKVLNNLSVDVSEGEMLALVGSSGCGKSTTIQLMERFYDTEAGEVVFDNFEIKALNVKWLRSQIGLVSQEPVLFDLSIAENIAYGDNSRQVSMEEIIEAAKDANIHDFITSLPEGYETRVGDKGTQLSGGQKQRVAIARALVRNPKILLLDEATSALDSESEKVVQDALDKAKEGRTCIAIAHRLSTIQNAEKIAVIKAGSVSELGTHQELLAENNFYHFLYTAQDMQH
ncbi:ATP-dependent translocase ABCB1-like isoform X2 [Anneissia japonica]|uniref:ATP-dependent translocase ABCB1-like isoform X2 n=1 Tax=Anneissia japonica TaxID=1529436 RepID=UPI0014256498|nr:ATP-dependent translocase ABCB1-like isoform X2 [Anneissia japonica]